MPKMTYVHSWISPLGINKGLCYLKGQTTFSGRVNYDFCLSGAHLVEVVRRAAKSLREEVRMACWTHETYVFDPGDGRLHPVSHQPRAVLWPWLFSKLLIYISWTKQTQCAETGSTQSVSVLPHTVSVILTKIKTEITHSSARPTYPVTLVCVFFSCVSSKSPGMQTERAFSSCRENPKWGSVYEEESQASTVVDLLSPGANLHRGENGKKYGNQASNAALRVWVQKHLKMGFKLL